MQALIISLVLFFGISATQAAEYALDKAHSQAGFKIRHFVSKTAGQFTDYDFKLKYDPANVEKSSVEATIQTKSVDTNNEKRDEHLRTADFFNVEKFPTMTFKSTGVKRIAPTKLQIDGTLTLLGVSKPVTLDVEEGGTLKDPWGVTRAGFMATTKINRKDFGMVFNKTLDTGGLMLGEEVEIAIDIEATQVDAKKKK